MTVGLPGPVAVTASDALAEVFTFPLITPVLELMLSPAGSPIALNVYVVPALALAPHFCFAQQLASIDPTPAAENAPTASSGISIVASTAASKNTDEKPLVSRWLDLKTFSHSERYRNAFQTGGQHVFDNAQQRSLIEGKLILDPEGRYDIGFRASSGRYFNWAFGSYTGAGFISRATGPAATASFFTPSGLVELPRAAFADPAGFATILNGIQSNGWEFYMRELYFSATPVKPVTVEFGSFGIERGYSTEITTFDEDGYLSGERIRLHDPKHLFFDEVAFTNAYFGDIDTVNLFDRGSSLKKFNYRQVTAKKQLNDRVALQARRNVPQQPSSLQPSPKQSGISSAISPPS